MLKRWFSLLPLCGLLLTGCGFERGDEGRVYRAPLSPPAEVVAAPVASGEWDERFVGTWLVDQPFHAGYEASFYTFLDDGTLIHEGNIGYIPHPTVGQVVAHEAPCDAWGCNAYDALVTCFFGSTWSAPSLDRLDIEGVCDDGESRRITLTFGAPASSNAVDWGQDNVDATLEGFAPENSGHGGFQWRYKKCFDASGAPLEAPSEQGWGCEQFADLDQH